MFRSSSKLLEQANDLVKQGNFAKAEERYSDAAAKLTREGDSTNAQLAMAYAAFLALARAGGDPAIYGRAAQSLQTLGGATLKIGLRDVSASSLSNEVAILGEDLAAVMMPSQSVIEQTNRAQRLREVGLRYQSVIRTNVILTKEMFQKETGTGASRAFTLFALSEEMMGESTVFTDPKKAGEHYQQASLFWEQAGVKQASADARSRAQQYQKSAKCWFCGREVTGQGVSFFQLPSELTLSLTKTESAAVLPSFDNGTNQIFSCRGCNSTMNTLSDSWAQKRAQEVYTKLEAEIEVLRKQIQNMRR